MELAAGTMVTDKVRLRKPLGEGGMGAVWVADHLTLDMPVAVKFIHANLVETHPELLQRFESEAKAAARIKSRHVVQVFDHGVTDDGTPYIVMEMLEGNTLAQWLDLEKRLSLHDTATIVSDVASALHKAHKNGIVHRDIKPDNIFIVEDDEEPYVKVLDFGIAKKAGTPGAKRVTAIGEMMGTPHYMSPEQAMNAADVDEQADLWALSVVAYEALTGQLPFSGDSLGQVVMALSRGDYPRASERVRVPRELDGWFERAFDKDLERRFRSASELSSQLNRIVDSATSSQQLRPLASIAPGDEPDEEPPSAPADGGAPPAARAVIADTIFGPSEGDIFAGRPHTLPSTTGDAPALDTQPAGGRDADAEVAHATEGSSARVRNEAPNRAPRAEPAASPVADKPLPELELDLHASRQQAKSAASRPQRQPAAAARRKPQRAARQPQPRTTRAQPRQAPRPMPSSAHRRAARTAANTSSAQSSAGAVQVATSDVHSYRDVVLVLVVVLVVMVAMPFFNADGQAHVAARLGSAAAAPFGILGVGLALVGIKVWKESSTAVLLLSSGGMLALGAAMGVAALSHAMPGLGLGDFADSVDLVGSVAAAAIPLGFSLHGARRGLEELQSKRATGYGSVLLLLSLIGLVAAYQLGTQAGRALLG